MSAAVVAFNGWSAECVYDKGMDLEEVYEDIDIKRASDVEWDKARREWVARIRVGFRNPDEPTHEHGAPTRDACIAWEIKYLNRRAAKLAEK